MKITVFRIERGNLPATELAYEQSITLLTETIRSKRNSPGRIHPTTGFELRQQDAKGSSRAEG